jgi:choline transport protein
MPHGPSQHLINIFVGRRIPDHINSLLTSIQVYFSVSTLLVTILVILVCAAPNYQSSVWVFTDTTNLNRSYDKSFLFVLCLLNNTYGFMGTDAGAHLAEEIPSPSTNAPKVMVRIPHSLYNCVYICTNSEKIYPVIIGLVTGKIPIL